MPPTISLCMTVKNEERLLAQCLESVRKAVDEIIVVDTGSTDRTVNIAKRHGADVLLMRSSDYLAKARNLSIQKARGAWILVLDADEQIARKDLIRLKQLISQSHFLAYRLPIRNYTKGQDLLWKWFPNDGQYLREEKFSKCPGYRLDKIIRLFRNGVGLRYDEDLKIHEHLLFSSKQEKRIGNESQLFIHHFQYLKGGNRFILKKQRRRLFKLVKIVRPLPKFAQVHLNIAITYFQLKHNVKAIEHIKTAIKLKPSLKDGYFLLGVVLNEIGRYRDAIRHLKFVVKLDPRCADTWTVMGMAYERLGKFKEAEGTLKKAIRFRSFHPLAHNSLGLVYQNKGKFSEAAKAYRKAIKIHPEHPDAVYNLGTLDPVS